MIFGVISLSRATPTDTYQFFFLMIRRPPRSTLDRSSAASDVFKRQADTGAEPFPVTYQFHQREIRVPDEGEPIPDDLETCLLYTSPSPRDRTRSRMPSSA